MKDYLAATSRARAAWSDNNLQECEAQLNIALQYTPKNDTLYRFRSMVRSRSGQLDDALADAGSAVANDPGNPRNHHALALASQHKAQLSDAGSAYLTSMNRGMAGSTEAIGFTGLLNAVRRQRSYYADIRPAHRKSVSNSLFLARSPSRATIFDPGKTLDEEEVAIEALELPEPPQLRLVRAEMNSVTVSWEPAVRKDSENITIYAYELQMAIHDVVYEGDAFFDGLR